MDADDALGVVLWLEDWMGRSDTHTLHRKDDGTFELREGDVVVGFGPSIRVAIEVTREPWPVDDPDAIIDWEN